MLLAAMFAVFFAGCSSLGPTAKAVFRLGLRAAVYTVTSTHPEVRPIISTIGAVFASPEVATNPKELEAMVLAVLGGPDGLDTTQRAMVAPLVAEALAFYAEVYKANLDALNESDYRKILTQIGEVMEAAVVPSVDGPADAFVLQTPGGIVQIE